MNYSGKIHIELIDLKIILLSVDGFDLKKKDEILSNKFHVYLIQIFDVE